MEDGCLPLSFWKGEDFSTALLYFSVPFLHGEALETTWRDCTRAIKGDWFVTPCGTAVTYSYLMRLFGMLTSYHLK
jgi:hypothetical protein